MPSPPDDRHGLFGMPPARLVEVAPGACLFSPLVPGAEALDAAPPGSLAGMVMLASPGRLERRYELAHLLRVLRSGATFTVLAPNEAGGKRLAQDLADLGCAVEERAKAHHRICVGRRPDAPNEATIAQAIEAGGPRRLAPLGLWTQPGVFSWDRPDPGSALLVETLPALSGTGADLGCGTGLLAHAVLAAGDITRLHLVDIDRRAVDAARRNVDDARVDVAWRDIRAGTGWSGLDFVVTNPPFHDAGTEDKGLGQVFIRRAAEALRKGGRLWLVANRHLPYEATLKPLFRTVAPRAEAHGYKVIEAVK